MTKTANYKLTGCILDLQSKPVPGLTVHAYDKDLLQKDDILGEATTDELGRYAIPFSAAQFKKGLEFLGPDVYIRVFHDNQLLGESEVERNAGHEINIDMQVDFEVVDKEQKVFTVSGAVRPADGSNRQGHERLFVQAYDQGLRDHALLGKSGVDDQARYSIKYTQTRLLNPERSRANLQIVVTTADDQVVGQSPITFNARPVETINLVVDPDSRKSEWSRLRARIPHSIDETELPKLTEEELEFLANSERLNLEHLEIAVKAHRLAAGSKLPAWFHYALGRQKLPLELGLLLDTPEARVFTALDSAQAGNIIDPIPKKDLAELRAQFEKLQGDHLLEKEFRAGGLKTGKVFAIAGLKDDEQRRLAIALLGKESRRFNGTLALPADTGLKESALKRAGSALFLADFAEHHEATVKELFKDSRTHEPRDLAKYFDPDDWKKVVNKTVKDDDLPADLEGITPDERRDAYARRLYTRAATAHPTVAVAYGLSRREALKGNLAAELLPGIVESDASFNLASTRLDGYLREKKETLGLKSDDAVSQATLELKRVQRLYRLKPEMGVIGTLLEDQIDSAAAIVQLGKNKFVGKYGKDDAVGEETARALYEQAEVTTARAFGLLSRFSPTINSSPLPAAIVACPAELRGTPNYSSLFGSLDGCECEPCESVYSPAAYLADLLAFLKREVEPIDDYFADEDLANSNGLEALAARSYCDRDNHLVTRQTRRPDIAGTLLSCRNAETEMPYVDLVLEILENAVRPWPGSTVLQTDLTADKLAAQPEHQNWPAYLQLAEAIFPLSLPFDLSHEEQKLYLEKLGTSLAELLEMFFPCARPSEPPDQVPPLPPFNPYDLTEIRGWQKPEIAKARLDLSDTLWSVIVNQDTSAATVRQAWGELTPNIFRTAASFLVPTELDYKDMLRLFGLKSFNPKGAIRVDERDLGRCIPEKIRIKGLGQRAASYLHRFLRLQRCLGWTMRELNQALLSLAPPPSDSNRRPKLDESFLCKLSHVFRLKERFKLPLTELLAWCSILDTHDSSVPQLPHETPEPSLYERLFLSGRRNEPEYQMFRLNDERTELRSVGVLTSTHYPAIAGALKLSLPDLRLLVDDQTRFDDIVIRTFNLELLSRLFRHASLARALRLRMSDYLTLKKSIAFDPFNAAELWAGESLSNTIQTLRFVARADAIKDSGFSIAELDYLLRQTMPFKSRFDEPTVAPTLEWVAKSLQTVASALTTAIAAAPSKAPLVNAINLLPLNPAADIAAEPLRTLIEDGIKSFEANNGYERNDFRELLSALYAARELLTFEETAPDTLNPDQQNDLREKVAAALAAYEPIIQSMRTPALETAATALAEILKISAAACKVLLEQMSLPADRGTKAVDALLAAVLIQPSQIPAELLQELVYLLHKASLVIDHLGISDKELFDLEGQQARFLTISTQAGWLDLTRLPVRGRDPAAVPPQDADPRLPFDDWLRTLKLFQFRDVLAPDKQGELFGLFTDAAQYLDKLVALSFAPEADIRALIGSSDPAAPGSGGILQPPTPDWFADERLLVRVFNAIQLLKRLGVSATDAAAWIDQTPGEPLLPWTRVERIKNALKARYGDAWFSVLKPLRDPLRERQRQALVTYLRHTWKLERPDDLFDHFLIDVEMSPCMMTSRLIQAVAAVQLFVQRVLMNLEPGMALTENGAEQWEWMKNYRVWEANRKIFLYPENWIEPDLRDDKTPFFKDLENELLQSDINNDTAETALIHYLEKLHDVSRLQVVGQYLEVSIEEADATLHVFARTRDVPHTYYYRKGILESLGTQVTMVSSGEFDLNAFDVLNPYWTPWERVDLDIEGDHLIPVVYNRRLYLFWPIFTEQDEPPFSNLERQLIELFQFGYYLQERLFTLVGEVGNLVVTVGQFLVAGSVQAVEGGINTILEALDALRSGLSDLNERFNEVEQSTEASIDSASHGAREVLRNIPAIGGGIDALFGLVENLVASVSNSGSVVFPGGAGLFNTFIPRVNISEGLGNPDPGAQVDSILEIIREVSERVNSFATGQFLSLLPAKRLEVQLAWSYYKSDTWTAKKTSTGLVSFRDVIAPLFEALPAFPGVGKPSTHRMFSFRSVIDSVSNVLSIVCDINLPTQNQCGATGHDRYREEPIGFFRLNGCEGRLEAVDLKENIDLLTVFSTLVDDLSRFVQQQVIEANRELHGIPSLLKGEPATPDDDPLRPSTLRCDLESVPLPRHFLEYSSVVTGNRMPFEDVYRLLALRQSVMFQIERSRRGADGRRVAELLLEMPKSIGFFYHDVNRTFYCFPWIFQGELGKKSYFIRYVFLPYYHPYSCVLLENIQRFGIRGLYDVRFTPNATGSMLPAANGEQLQMALKDESYFETEYNPVSEVYNPPDGDRALRPIEEINFSTIGAYSQYNWEIFFHIPLLIATRLATNQNFREAQHWFHYIFNPTDHSRGAAPGKYWRTRPFVEATQEDYNAQDIDDLLRLLSDPANTSQVLEIERAVSRWRHDAFNPHLIARTRTVAFQKSVVMKYIDNLIAWGDSLFRQETRESVNEAMQLYVLAAKLLGPRPHRIPKSLKRPEKSFSDLEATLDSFSNALVDFENYLPAARSSLGVDQGRAGSKATLYGGKLDKGSLMSGETAYRNLVQNFSLRNVTRNPGELQDDDLYFCVPPNDKLLAKWDLVADRLFKIRHCQNIRGQALSLALLSPPIDPALLVRASAVGVSIDDVLSQLQSPPPHYRFQVLSQKATELCGEVKSLGSALLSAIEKRDGEELALLRTTHEIRMLEAVRAVKKQQVKEANLSLENLKHSQESATIRRDHYQRLLLEFMNPEEIASAALSAISLILQVYQTGIKWGSVPASLIPNIKGGFVTTLGATYGGNNLGDAASRASDAIGTLASTLSSAGGLISTFGTYHRRADDWFLQITLANKELEGLEKQIVAAEIRVAIAEAEVENQQLQIQNSKETQEFMQQKFTNHELFDWMVAQTSSLYFQSYQLALEVARKAERSFALELGVDERGIIQGVHWDSLKKGLLAGDHLHHDLKRLEVAYLNENAREYELTKHVSLRQLDPLALLELRATGSCSMEIPEVLFDLDCPGHYFRRIKTVALTIPCITGPYANVNCKLSLVKSGIRKEPILPDGVYTQQLADVSHTQSIVTSSAQNDSGLLETNLRDERYLPFENAGAISNWRLELPANPSEAGLCQFDYDTISDVVLHLRYTARDDTRLRPKVTAFLNAAAGLDEAPRICMFSVRHDFSADWSKFKNQPAPEAEKLYKLSFELRPEHYPYWSQNQQRGVEYISVVARSEKQTVEIYKTDQRSDQGQDKDVLRPSDYGKLLYGQLERFSLAEPVGPVTFFLDDNSISDLWIAVAWTNS